MNCKKFALMEKLSVLGLNERHPGYTKPLPLVTLEDFFDGNNDKESIAVNLLSTDPYLDSHPGIDFIFSKLREIRARTDVQCVFVEVFEIETALQDENTWPFAEKIFIVTCASQAEIEGWNSVLCASGAIKGYEKEWHVNPPTIEPGFEMWRLVWD